jgi:hypothetical protein
MARRRILPGYNIRDATVPNVLVAAAGRRY